MLPLGTELVGYYDEQSHPNPTIRHVECELITGRSSAGRCFQCQKYSNPFHEITINFMYLHTISYNFKSCVQNLNLHVKPQDFDNRIRIYT